jgi:type VI secretion system protein ImpL
VSAGMLAKFEAAQRIRDTFFRSGTPLPEWRFTVTPAGLDASVTRFTLEIDGQTFDYRHGPERSWPAVWPGPNPGVAAATFEVRTGGDGPNNMVFQGPWAWFRLIDATQVQRETDVRYALSFQKGGHEARVKVEASSIRNPFATRDVQQFRCGPVS